MPEQEPHDPSNISFGLDIGASVVPGCRRCGNGGRQHRWWRYRKPPVGPARSKNHGMYGASLRENREIPCPSVRLITGRAARGRPRP